MRSTTASATIDVLRSIFSRFGFPVQVVSDNGPQFISEEYKSFLKRNGVTQTLCPPYHPASNGLAEKHVQTFKRMFKAADASMSLQHRVSHVLFRYRNIPHTTTGRTPAEQFLKRAPRTQLSLVKPSLQRKVEKRQTQTKFPNDGVNPKMRSFDLHQHVRVRNLRGGKERWIPWTIVEVKGPVSYIVRVPGNSRRYVHVDHLIPDDARRPISDSEKLTGDNVTTPVVIARPVVIPNVAFEPIDVPAALPAIANPPERNVVLDDMQVRTSRSGRVIKSPIRLDL